MRYNVPLRVLIIRALRFFTRLLRGQEVVFDLDSTGFESIRTEILDCVVPIGTTHMISDIQAEFTTALIESLSALTLLNIVYGRKAKIKVVLSFSRQ